MSEKAEASNGRLSIGTGLAKFQSLCGAATRDSDQAFYKSKDGTPSKYADLNSIIEASKEPKEKAGIAFSTVPDFTVEKLKSVKTTTFPDGRVEVIEKEHLEVIEFTRSYLMCGENWLESKMTIKTGAKGPDDPQAVGAGLTYNRRQQQGAMLNLRTADGEDDDGESVIGEKERAKRGKAKPSVPKKPVSDTKRPVMTPADGELI